MRVDRRGFLHLAFGGAAMLPARSRSARAQAYPTRPVRWIVPIAAGGTQDILARLMGQWLTDRLGQPFVIENRPGGSGNIGTEAVVRAPADGYSLLLVSSQNTNNATLYDKLNFDIIRDISPVAGLIRGPFVVVVNPTVPVGTIPELIAYAKAHPGKLSMASAGIGTGPHLAGELFKMMAGVDMAHVPYRGGAPALTGLLGGQVQVMFPNTAASIQYVTAGSLRALAVTTAARSDVLPDTPTVAEFIPGYEASSMFGVGAPRNTPPDVVGTLNREINAALADPSMKVQLAKLDGEALPLSPAGFGKLIADETEKWGKVIRAANIKPT